MSDSKVLTYDYLRFVSKSPKTQRITGEAFAPVVVIRISHDRKLSVPLHAIVDSGSSKNLLPASFAEQVGIKVKRGRMVKILGIGNTEVTAYSHKVKIYLGLNLFETEVDFSFEQDIPLLGRDGFFNLFQKIIFDENFHQVQLILKNKN